MPRTAPWLALLLVGCLEFDEPNGPAAEPERVCDKMEDCDYRYEQVNECEDQLLEDGEGGAVCADREAYLKCIRPHLKGPCSDFEVGEYDCYVAWCE